MKILYTVFADSRPGLATLDVFFPANYLVNKGHDVLILCSNDGFPRKIIHKKGTLTVYPELTPIKRRRKKMFDEFILYFCIIFELIKIHNIFKNYKPEIMLCDSSYVLPILGYITSKLYKIPLIIMHRELLLESFQYEYKLNKMIKYILYLFMKINHYIFKKNYWNIAIDKSISNFMNIYYNINNIIVINLICIYVNKSVMSNFTKKAHGITILYSGDLNPIRRVDLLIDAFININKKYPQTNLIITGKNTDINNPILKRILKLNDNKQTSIKYLGFISRKKLIDVIMSSDICIEPYPKKTWTPSGKLIEYMSLEKCCIATDIYSNRLFIKNGKTGLLFRPNSLSDLESKLLQVISCAELRERLGKNALLFAMKYFNPEQCGKAFEHFLINVLSNSHNN
jgi:glycosyltransferase involved in cell wall biosynthesis